MSRELSELIDKALARRSSLLGLITHVVSNGNGSEALQLEYEIAELDGLLSFAARTSVMH
jgi:hypothetical protein